MAEASPRYNDEIDLIELFLTLWAGKWIIIGFTTVCLTIAIIHLALVEPKYETRILIKQNIVPSFIETPDTHAAPAPEEAPHPSPAIEDYIDKFYSQEIFKVWANENSNKLLTPHLRLSQFDSIKNKQTELIIKTGDPKIIDAYFQYANFINRLLTQDYQKLSKEELIFLKEQAEDIGVYSDQIVNLLLNTNRFLKNATKGELVLDLKKPTERVKIFPRTEWVLALAVFLGSFVGCASTLLINIVRKRKICDVQLKSNDG